jgi:redox-sensitive bicupin YhaK (pirin superfamily)
MKKITSTSQGQRADVGPYKVMRLVGNRHVDVVGPFVLLDHALPVRHTSDEPRHKANGEGAHPHRGIATLTYLLNGEATHLDSRGHYATVGSGGAQWMKAGNGIIHDEVFNVDAEANDMLTQALQFWVNLPAKNKAELPEYVALQAADIPKKDLDKKSGWLKVVVGQYENLVSKIPTYTEHLIYHLHLLNGKEFSLEAIKGWEYAAFLLSNNAVVQDNEYKKGDLLLFDKDEGTIEISNTSKTASDIILFGGEPYTEPIIAQGPFVMNTEHEISQAYNDFYDGKYGEINYRLDERK